MWEIVDHSKTTGAKGALEHKGELSVNAALESLTSWLGDEPLHPWGFGFTSFLVPKMALSSR